jgi:hypothetical protein
LRSRRARFKPFGIAFRIGTPFDFELERRPVEQCLGEIFEALLRGRRDRSPAGKSNSTIDSSSPPPKTDPSKAKGEVAALTSRLTITLTQTADTEFRVIERTGDRQIDVDLPVAGS